MNARLVQSIWIGCEITERHHWTGSPIMRGNIAYYCNGLTGKTAGMLLICGGCCAVCSCAFEAIDGHPSWTWDGNRERPTLSPSIHHDPAKGGCGWHVFLKDGVFA